MNDLRDDVVANVRVGPAFARAKLQGDRINAANDVDIGLVLKGIELVRIFSKAGGVREKMADGDGFPCVRHIIDILIYGVVEFDLALLNKREHACGEELFAHGSDFVSCLGCGWSPIFNVSQTVSLGANKLSVSTNHQRETGNALPTHLGVYAIVDIVSAGEDLQNCQA